MACVVTPGSKAILTCRTEHFPTAKEGRSLLNAELSASTSDLTGEPPQFEVIELLKFKNDQIHQLICLHSSQSIADQIVSNQDLLDLARRPLMIEMILDALPDIKAGKPIDMSRTSHSEYTHLLIRKLYNSAANLSGKCEKVIGQIIDGLQLN